MGISHLNGTRFRVRLFLGALLLFAAALCFNAATRSIYAQGMPAGQRPTSFQGETTQEYNQRLEQLRKIQGGVPEAHVDESHIGPEDLLEITVFEAPELNRSLRVSANGAISLPLLGAVKAAGLTPG